MAIFFQSILLVLIFLIVPTYFLYQRISGNTTKSPPPGSFGFPLVGETHKFFFNNLEIFLQERKTKYSSDFFKTNILGEPTVILSGPNGNKFLSLSEPRLVKVWYLKTQRKFFNILSQPPQQAAKSNSTPIKILGFFKPEGLMKYMGKIESITQQHLRAYWEGKNELEIYPLLKFFALTVVYQIYFGLDDPGRVAKFVNTFDRLHAGIYSIPVNFPGTRYHRGLKAAGEIRKEVQFIIQEKIDALSSGFAMDDLLAQVIEAEKGGKYVPKLEVCNIIMGLMNSSYTALATVLTLMIKHIGLRPEIYQKLVSGDFLKPPLQLYDKFPREYRILIMFVVLEVIIIQFT